MSTIAEPEQVARAPLDPERTIWREYTNGNGKKYRVGYDIPVNEDLEKAKETVAGFKDPNSREASVKLGEAPEYKYKIYDEVSWAYDDGVTYKLDASSKVRKDTGIYEYQVGWNYFGYYNYRVIISTNNAWYYTFYDQDGNHYTLNVDSTLWSHQVCFDTDDNKKPTIERIKAEWS
ncbi:hypothetical protein BJ165DRAFT_1403634 [Panaeolus papilionaceus]|nr:hypothetical protein BJ165DRAFT_1403634 [Panaeolus papilionaceus]